MRRARITYEGALHHAMNRGHEGKPIFKNDSDKEYLLNLLKTFSQQLNIRILAYCIMNNHYHLVLENTSGRMSDFFKQINGQYGTYYRKKYGGHGYVFQDRFKSFLVQDEAYLLVVTAYVLNNPVRARLVKNSGDYKFSSHSLYFNDKSTSEFVDNNFVEELFETSDNFIEFLDSTILDELPLTTTRVGRIIGGEELIFKGMKKFNRRSGKESIERKRIDDKHFDPIEKIFQEFQVKRNYKLEEIDTTTYTGKRTRGELLVNLKDQGGLKYSDIIKMDIFGDLKMNSLGQLYKRSKKRLMEKRERG